MPINATFLHSPAVEANYENCSNRFTGTEAHNNRSQLLHNHYYLARQLTVAGKGSNVPGNGIEACSSVLHLSKTTMSKTVSLSTLAVVVDVRSR